MWSVKGLLQPLVATGRMPWFAVNSHSGLPENSRALYERHKYDLNNARRDRLYTYLAEVGDTVSRWFGQIEVEYTCVSAIEGQGDSCMWRAQYYSRGRDITWLHKNFDTRTKIFTGSDVFGVCPQ